MKTFVTVILSLLACSCSDKIKSLKTNDVFILWYPTDFEGKKIAISKSTSPIRFSKEYWNYFLQSHPKVSMTIFASHLYEEHYPNLDTGDSTYSYYEVGKHNGDLGLILADSAGGVEKLDKSFSTVWRNDNIGRPLPYHPHGMKVSTEVAKEFDEFKRILSNHDTAGHYVIVYRNSFLDFNQHQF